MIPMDINAFLSAQRVAHLATIGPEGAPHIVPVVYVYDGEQTYIPIDEKPKRVAPMRLQRIQNILAKPRVALIVDRYDEDWSRLAWVRLDGKARIVRGGKTHAAAIARLREKYAQYRAMDLEKRPLIVITVDKIAAWQADQV